MAASTASVKSGQDDDNLGMNFICFSRDELTALGPIDCYLHVLLSWLQSKSAKRLSVK